MPFFEDVVVPSLQEGVDVDEFRNSFEAYVSKQSEESAKGLAKNKESILEEKKAIQAQLSEMKEKYGFLEDKEFSMDTYNTLMSELETYKASAAENQDDFRQQLNSQYEKGKQAMEEQIKPKLNSLDLQLKEAMEAKEKYQNSYRDYMAESRLRASLSKIQAEPDEFWFEGFKNKAQIEYDDDGIKDISVYHEGTYLPIGDWEKIFPTTERGKKMIKAPLNIGAGGKGSGSNGGKPTTIDEINEIPDDRARRKALSEYMAQNEG